MVYPIYKEQEMCLFECFLDLVTDKYLVTQDPELAIIGRNGPLDLMKLSSNRAREEYIFAIYHERLRLTEEERNMLSYLNDDEKLDTLELLHPKK